MQDYRKVHYYCHILARSKILNSSDINFLRQKIKAINKKDKNLCNVKDAEKKLNMK